MTSFRICIAISLALLISGIGSAVQQRPLSRDEEALEGQIRKLRSVPDADRGKVTRDIALAIRKLPPSENRVMLANGLANLSTEGDFGEGTLQQVGTTLADALRDNPQPTGDPSYSELAQLARYEHVKVALSDPKYVAAVAEVVRVHQDQARVDFTLKDLNGTSWNLDALRGKVVIVNFWATWCPPCRKEMPDLEKLFEQLNKKGLVVIAISDEDISKVQPFIAQHGYTFPVLLDPGDKIHTAYHIEGIPNSFVYDRGGKLVAQAIDMRTRGQFLKLLEKAGMP